MPPTTEPTTLERRQPQGDKQGDLRYDAGRQISVTDLGRPAVTQTGFVELKTGLRSAPGGED